MLPKLKKKVTSFLLSEEGKMPKHSLLSLGSFLSAAIISGVIATKQAAASIHSNAVDATSDSTSLFGAHSHHTSHSSHGSHGSHSSHASAVDPWHQGDDGGWGVADGSENNGFGP